MIFSPNARSASSSWEAVILRSTPIGRSSGGYEVR